MGSSSRAAATAGAPMSQSAEATAALGQGYSWKTLEQRIFGGPNLAGQFGKHLVVGTLREC